MAERALTYPHDYRALFGGPERPTIVGGQAVNLWAIIYLDPSGRKGVQPGSHDMDVISSTETLTYLKTLPNWKFAPTPMKHFGVGITAKLQSVASDGRVLLVEVLHSVAGLDAADLRRISEVEVGGTKYCLLDPIAMLKAKAYNVRKFEQDDDPPRHDREHLALVARCVSEFLREIHAGAIRLQKAGDPAAKSALANAADAVSAAFKTLSNHDTASILRQQGIAPETLVPAEFTNSLIPKIANACKHQLPRIALAGLSGTGKVGP